MTASPHARHKFVLRVWGENACFTRPEMKVERVSYDVMTPAAARGLLEAILWKPAISWRILQIDVMRPIRWESVRRNEVSEVDSIDLASAAMAAGRGRLGLFVEEARTQRACLMLRQVEYRIHAGFVLGPLAGPDDTAVKFASMFRRRAETGQCFHQPYLGCREFAASFELVEEGNLPDPISEDRELGWMLYDLEHSAGEARPCFFRARLVRGVLQVPDQASDEVQR